MSSGCDRTSSPRSDAALCKLETGDIQRLLDAEVRPRWDVRLYRRRGDGITIRQVIGSVPLRIVTPEERLTAHCLVDHLPLSNHSVFGRVDQLLAA